MDRALLTSGASPEGHTTPQGYRMRLRLVGRMQVADAAGRSILPRARKTRALLAMLALAAPRPIARSRLVDLLWSTRGKEQGRGSLRQAIHEMQQSLGADLSTVVWADRSQVGLVIDEVWIDVHEILGSTMVNPKGLDLLDGDLLSDLEGFDPAFDNWLALERRRLRDAAMAVAARLLREREAAAASVGTPGERSEDDPHGLSGLQASHIGRGAGGATLPVGPVSDHRGAGRLEHVDNSNPYKDVLPQIGSTLGGDPGPRGADAESRLTGSSWPGQHTHAIERVPGRLRIGVMPVRQLDDLPDDPLPLGLTEEIAVALARVKWLSCVTHTSLRSPPSDTHDAETWARLCIDILLDGTVQRRDTHVRVTMRLLDLRDGGVVCWARRYDRDSGDNLQIQEEIAGEIVAQIDAELLLREGERIRATPPTANSTAEELTLRAVPSISRLEESGFATAGSMLRRAIDREQNHGAAHAWLAYWQLFLVGQGWTEEPQIVADEAGALADRALTLAPNDARCITLSGHVRSFLGRRPAEGIVLHQRAINLNPNLPMAWAFLGLGLTYLGSHDEAIAAIRQAFRLSPHDPHGFFFEMALTMPHLLKHDHAMVVEIGRRAIVLNPGFSSAYKGVLAALGHLGRTAEAANIRARLLRIEPKFTVADAVRRSPILCATDLAHYAEGLRLGGLP